jgi:tetratricopeptide (TPR) repeat protein
VAYEHAIKDTKSPLYDKSLYKLGWTYYRQDRFEPAVQRFLELVDYYDRTGRRRTASPPATSAARRSSTRRFSFAGREVGLGREGQGDLRQDGRPPLRGEVYRRMGDVYFDQTRHTDAIAAYRLALQRDPLAGRRPEAPAEDRPGLRA